MSKTPVLSLLAVAALALALAPALAQAQSCPSGTKPVSGGTPSNPNTAGGGNFSSFISKALICAKRGADRWQEFHESGGALWDYKLGPRNTIDPTEQVGTWSVSSNAVTHTYGAQSYTWAVCKDDTGPAYTLVSTAAGTITGVTILTASSPQTASGCP